MQPPIVRFCEDNNILCYSASCSPFFDENKNRISKGNLSTVPIKTRPGGWDTSAIRTTDSCYMFRCGAKPSGSGYLVIDLDINGDEQVEIVFYDFYERIWADCSCIVRTASGGQHLYYRIPEGMNWTKELNIDDITIGGVSYDTHGKLDIIATGGGVLLPGSSFQFQKKKHEYSFLKGESIADAGLLPSYLVSAFNERRIMAQLPKKIAPPPPNAGKIPPSPPSPPLVARSITPLKVSGDELRLITSLCNCLTPEWLDKYTNWRDLVYCLKNITGGKSAGRELAISIAKKSPRHDNAMAICATTELYEKAVGGSIGFGSLSYWAKQCSPEKHHNCFKDNYQYLLFEGNKGHSDIFCTELAGSCVYNADEQLFWLWVEHKQLWKPVCEDNITSLFMTIMPQVVKKIRASLKKGNDDSPEDKKDKELLALQRKFNDGMAESIMKCMRDALNPVVSYRNIDAFDLDKNPNYLPLGNGVWNFKENKLEEYTRHHYVSKRLDKLAYNPAASQEHIKKAMKVWFKGNQEVIDFVQYWLGYMITGYLTRQDFLIVFGSSAGNGKTTLFEEILQQDILGGQFATSLGEDALTKTGGNNDDIYYSFGKRLALCSESGNTGSGIKEININALKRVTGNGVIAAEAKFKGKKEESFTAKVVFICNEMPKMPQDKGQRRRTNVLEMNVKFVYPGEWEELSDEEKASGNFGVRHPEFITALRANREGTLLWLLDGSKKYMENPELTAPAAIRRYTDEALANACPNRKWFMDGYECHKKHKGQELDFKDIAILWAEHFGVKSTNMVARGKFLKIVRELVGDSNVSGDSNHGYKLINCAAKV